jgi:hypothetical protein
MWQQSESGDLLGGYRPVPHDHVMMPLAKRMLKVCAKQPSMSDLIGKLHVSRILLLFEYNFVFAAANQSKELDKTAETLYQEL